MCRWSPIRTARENGPTASAIPFGWIILLSMAHALLGFVYLPSAARCRLRCLTSQSSFDHFVGSQQDRFGEFDTKRSRSSQVYCQLELCWLFDGEIRWLCTSENFVDIGGRTAIHIIDVWSIGDEAANIDKIAGFVNHRKSLFSGKLDYARSLTEGKGIDEQ